MRKVIVVLMVMMMTLFSLPLTANAASNVVEVTSADQLTSFEPNTTYVLQNDILVDKMVNIDKDGVTLDLNGLALSASEKFTGTYDNDKHLVQVYQASNVCIKGGTLYASSSNNKHVLNIYQSQDVKLGEEGDGLLLDHTDAGIGGAPLVINASTVIVDAYLDLLLGENSWYGINVDSKGTEASIDFSEWASVTTNDTEKVIIFAQNGAEVNNSENAGLQDNGNGVYGPCMHENLGSWEYDESWTDQHFQICQDCGAVVNEQDHQFVWVIDKEATATEKGSKHEECTLCGYEKAAIEIPALGNVTDNNNTGDNDKADNDKDGNAGDDVEKDSTPGTGDSMPMISLILIMAIAAVGIGGVFVRRRA